MLRTGVVVVRRTTRVSASSSSTARVVSDTCTVTVCPARARPRANLLAADHDHAGGAGASLHPDRLGRRPGRWPGGAGAAQPGHLGGGERVGPGAQQYPGGRVVEHQRVLLDADADQLSAEDLRGGAAGVGRGRPGRRERPAARSRSPGRPRPVAAGRYRRGPRRQRRAWPGLGWDRGAATRMFPRTLVAKISGSPGVETGPARAAGDTGGVYTSPRHLGHPKASSRHRSYPSSAGNGGYRAFAILEGAS